MSSDFDKSLSEDISTKEVECPSLLDILDFLKFPDLSELNNIQWEDSDELDDILNFLNKESTLSEGEDFATTIPSSDSSDILDLNTTVQKEETFKPTPSIEASPIETILNTPSDTDISSDSPSSIDTVVNTPIMENEKMIDTPQSDQTPSELSVSSDLDILDIPKSEQETPEIIDVPSPSENDLVIDEPLQSDLISETSSIPSDLTSEPSSEPTSESTSDSTSDSTSEPTSEPSESIIATEPKEEKKKLIKKDRPSRLSIPNNKTVYEKRKSSPQTPRVPKRSSLDKRPIDKKKSFDKSKRSDVRKR
jgi:hypothetical protein